jgi:dTDP-4-amino-4,6-dideoxygalactose transaminase
MDKIHMVDLKGQYLKLKPEIDTKIADVLASTQFVKGQEVLAFEKELADYLGVKHVISCGNGTDALQIALMGLDLQTGDEVITVDFTFAATVEVIALLGLTPILIDVNPDTMTMDVAQLEAAITPRTKAIVPVHLFGQCANMESVMNIAKKNNLYVIEDNAQAIGADFIFKSGKKQKAGTIGHIGTTSFFPSKNLGAYGDGGAVFTNDDQLAYVMRGIANHGMYKRYYYDRIGINSRLDTLQAGILRIKLKYLDEYAKTRQQVADYYDKAFQHCKQIVTPQRAAYSTHVFHQYTIQLKNVGRDELKTYLQKQDIPSMIYYPVPLHTQKAYQGFNFKSGQLSNTTLLCNNVLSLPIHTEITEEQLEYITEKVLTFINLKN